MKVTIDCGSTKCDFAFSDKSPRMQCRGFNPAVSENEVLENSLRSDKALFEKLSQASQIHYYGAGCSNEKNKQRVHSLFSSLFPMASTVISHDLDLSLDLLAKDQICFVNILGTGSNSVFYDSSISHQLVPSLGYILGDEGSGTWFGKRILRDYFYNKLPKEIYSEIKQKENLELSQAVEKLYKTKGANKYIASYSIYLSSFRKTEYVQALLKQGFEEFLDVFIPKDTAPTIPLHFTGSIAHYFKEELAQVLKSRNLLLGKIVKSPLDELENVR